MPASGVHHEFAIGRQNGRMRAAVHDRYGPPDVLRITEVPDPVPAADEVLVRVHATTVSRTDVGLRSAELIISRAITGLRAPKRPILGMEFAGIVDGQSGG